MWNVERGWVSGECGGVTGIPVSNRPVNPREVPDQVGIEANTVERYVRDEVDVCSKGVCAVGKH